MRKGEIDKDLAAMAVGKTGHSRWLTTANLFCDWWCRRHGLEGELLARLREIVSFIVNVYYPCWFRIKVMVTAVCSNFHKICSATQQLDRRAQQCPLRAGVPAGPA